jgi:hypothetical protein
MAAKHIRLGPFEYLIADRRIGVRTDTVFCPGGQVDPLQRGPSDQ